MKKIILGLLILLALVGCSDDDVGAPAVDRTETGDLSWFGSIDPITGRSFRCLYFYRDRGYGGGPAVWCYETAVIPDRPVTP